MTMEPIMTDSTGSSIEYVGRVAQQTLHDYIAKTEELTAAHDRLRKENAALRGALKATLTSAEAVRTDPNGVLTYLMRIEKTARAALQGAKEPKL